MSSKLWVDQGREFYNKIMQKWLANNDILIFLTYDEGKSVLILLCLKKLRKIVKLLNIKFMIESELLGKYCATKWNSWCLDKVGQWLIRTLNDKIYLKNDS